MGLPVDADSLLLLVLAGMGGVAWWLLAYRHYAAVAWMVVGTLIAMVLVSALMYGSVRTVNVGLILVAQVAVGLLLSQAALVWTTAGAVLLLGALTWADTAGALIGVPDFEVGWRTWISQAACLVGVAGMMYLNGIQFSEAQTLHLKEASARLQVLKERDRERERFARVFQSSPTPLFVQSTQTGQILDVNPAFERVFGFSRNDVIHRRDGFLWLHDEHHEVFSRERRANRRSGWWPVTAIGRGGHLMPIHICSQRDDDPDDGLVITAVRPMNVEAGEVANQAAPEGAPCGGTHRPGGEHA